MDKTAIIIIIVIILASVLFFVWYSVFATKISIKPSVMPEGIVLFYGQGCPHCKNVDDFVAQNKIEDKVKFTRLEVWHNQGNAELLVNVATGCKLDVTNGVPVPFLYDGKNCLTGDVEIINFFKNAAANIK